jgi:acyl-CoA thioester hydrolase
MVSFAKEIEVRWSDCDPNRHLRSSAFSDFATHVRFGFLESRGFPIAEFGRLDLGPAVRSEEILYFREIGLGDSVTVDVQLAGLSPDGARWKLRHEFKRGDGALAARQTLAGGWISLTQRKLVVPPAALADAFRSLARAEDFEELASLQPKES